MDEYVPVRKPNNQREREPLEPGPAAGRICDGRGRLALTGQHASHTCGDPGLANRPTSSCSVVKWPLSSRHTYRLSSGFGSASSTSSTRTNRERFAVSARKTSISSLLPMERVPPKGQT